MDEEGTGTVKASPSSYHNNNVPTQQSNRPQLACWAAALSDCRGPKTSQLLEH